MISLAGRETVLPFLEKRTDIFALKQRAMLEVYGGRCDFWVQEGLLLSRLSDVITLCGEAREPAVPELICFLRGMGRAVEGDAALLKRLFAAPGVLPVMAAPRVETELLKETYKSFPSVRVTAPDRLGPVYELLTESDKSFAASVAYDSWLVDFSHRCRHGFSRCYVLEVENRIIATFSILFRGPKQSLGGAFTVRPQWRGKGFGTLLLAHVAAEEPGLRLIAGGEALKTYYSRRGWKECGKAARVTFMEEL